MRRDYIFWDENKKMLAALTELQKQSLRGDEVIINGREIIFSNSPIDCDFEFTVLDGDGRSSEIKVTVSKFLISLEIAEFDKDEKLDTKDKINGI